MILTHRRPNTITQLLLVATLLATACVSVPEPGAHPSTHSRAPRFTPTRPVVVIPGFGNSKLWDPAAESYVWGTPGTTIFTRYDDDLDLPFDTATGRFGFDNLVPRGGFAGSRGPVNIAWRISHGLVKRGSYHWMHSGELPADNADIHPFAFDFRLSAVDNARRLDAFIDDIRVRHRDPALKVDIIAFSAGGMVALTYAKLGTADLDRPDTWDAGSRAAASKMATMLLVATPQEGTNESIRVLFRGEKIIRREWPQEMMATFPSIAEMLPEARFPLVDETGRQVAFDVWSAADWRELRFGIYSDGVKASFGGRGDEWSAIERGFRASLTRAARFREALRTRPFPEGVQVTALAGDCIPTARQVLLRRDGTLAFYPSELLPGERHLESVLFVPGDGSISADSATAQIGWSEFFCRGHQGIASDAGAHEAMLSALAKGFAADLDALADTAAQGMESASSR
ncbi:MAG: hypothetical protein WC538_04820 [Thermoanaerobaculia bacterium]